MKVWICFKVVSTRLHKYSFDKFAFYYTNIAAGRLIHPCDYLTLFKLCHLHLCHRFTGLLLLSRRLTVACQYHLSSPSWAAGTVASTLLADQGFNTVMSGETELAMATEEQQVNFKHELQTFDFIAGDAAHRIWQIVRLLTTELVSY